MTGVVDLTFEIRLHGLNLKFREQYKNVVSDLNAKVEEVLMNLPQESQHPKMSTTFDVDLTDSTGWFTDKTKP